jgi:hypothetical protein
MTRRWTGHGMAAVAMALVLSSFACGGDQAPDPPASLAPSVTQDRPASTGELTIVSPENGERISGDTARLQIDLQGAEVVDQTSTDLQPDEGHLHVVLDGKLVSMTSGTSQRLQGLTPGEHLLQVEFVANDHAPFDPRVLAAVTFEVQA